MFGPKISISKDLHDKLKERAEQDGYSSVEEFVIHVLETIVEPPSAEGVDEDVIAKQLQGLGYID